MTPESGGLVNLFFTQVWQVTVVAAIAAVVVACGCRRRPRLAYLLGLVVLAKCWMPPIWSSRFGVFCWPPRFTEASLSTEPANVQSRAAMVVDQTAADSTVAHHPESASVSDVSRAPEPELHPFDSLPRSPTLSTPALLGCLWLFGAVALTMAAWYEGWRWRKRLPRHAAPPDSRLNALAADLALRLGLRRRPRVELSMAAVGPAVFRLLRPTIVLPASLVDNAGPERLEMVLAHEMIHIRRGDLLVGAVQWCTQIVWWFHPLVWLTCRQLTRERERCCDEEVLAALRCRGVSYAQCLLDVLRLNRRSPWLPAYSGMRAVAVTRRRFEHILHCDAMAPRGTPLGYWLLAIAALFAILPGDRLTSAPPNGPDEKSDLQSHARLPDVDESRLSLRERTSRREAKDDEVVRPVIAHGYLDASEEPAARETGIAPLDSAPFGPDAQDLAPVQPEALVDESPAPAPAAEDANVKPVVALKQALVRGAGYLKAEQRDDGSWGDPVGYPGGITSLCTLALLRSGVSPDAPSVQAALKYLRKIKPQRTYSTSLQTMVFCAANDPADRRLIQRNVDWLCAQQKQVGPFAGAWAYPEAEGDNSNTAFAVMALYEAEQVGVQAPAAAWRRALDHWVNAQNPNGSWGYKPLAPGTGSMTSQGMFCVTVAARMLDEQKPDQPGPQAIDRAIRWLGRNFSVVTNPGSRGAQGWLFYYLHALAGAAHAGGTEKFGDHDWFAEGMQTLLAQQQPGGWWKGSGHAEEEPHLATSFALLFLSRGREKVK
jgi:beta-lactamase regulating signal transducer with metallopeptidase domain